MIANELSWFYINLSSLHKDFTKAILCEELNVPKDLVTLFEMVILLTEVLQNKPELLESMKESYHNIKLHIVWAVGTMVSVDDDIFAETMFHNKFLSLITNDAMKHNMIHEDYAEQIMYLLSEVTMHT